MFERGAKGVCRHIRTGTSVDPGVGRTDIGSQRDKYAVRSNGKTDRCGRDRIFGSASSVGETRYEVRSEVDVEFGGGFGRFWVEGMTKPLDVTINLRRKLLVLRFTGKIYFQNVMCSLWMIHTITLQRKLLVLRVTGFQKRKF
ncbi:hypothetical protein JTE90_003746 [Oedothorax gibbosus]|uniref:Uncharacterized protein n=1 Tax=Oedothorax gibbosus TaxID=931172 RepID=A0AAV6VAP9_9ARAC|nr:hypothetical protein JTE90_003746 [Oedothorax gibbosus]